MVSALLGLIGIAICVIAGYEAMTYWKTVYYVGFKNYAMMIYYGLIECVGIACICC